MLLSDCDLGRLLADHLRKTAADDHDGAHIIVCTDDEADEVRCVIAPLFPVVG